VTVALALAAAGEWLLLDPWFLALAPAAWLVLAWRWRRPRAALPTASVTMLGGLPQSLRARAVWLPSALVALGATALAVAMARPVRRELLPLREQGVDILLLLDVSSSMGINDMVEDGSVRRVEAARQQALDFARGRRNDRVGLMIYARYAELRCPLTLDERALAAFLQPVDIVQPGSEEDATAIGVALAQAVRFLEESKAPSKVVVLLTDGENNVDEITPQEAGKLAADAGIRVHTIGLGHGALVADLFGGRRLLPVDFGAIEEVARLTGGRFFRALDAESLRQVYAEIDRMEKVELEDPRYRTADGFGWLLAPGAAALALALLLELLWIRGVP
jgi:Ca-activated chloride channel family protein